MICIGSTVDFLMDCMFADNMRRKGRFDVFWACIVFTVVPILVVAYCVLRELKVSRHKLDKKQLANLHNVVLVLLIPTNPECLVLLPWTVYQIKDDIVHPNKDVMKLTLLNLVEEVPQFVIQFLYSWYNEDETTSVEWGSLVTTSMSLLYVITQKLLAFYCLDENPIKLIEEPYQTWYRSNDLKRFLRDIEEFPPVEYEKTVAKLKAKNVKNLKTMMDLQLSDNVEFEMDIKTELFRLITEHADVLNGHFDRDRESDWQTDQRKKVTQVHAALAAEVVHDNPNSHRESNPMVGPPIVAKVLGFGGGGAKVLPSEKCEKAEDALRDAKAKLQKAHEEHEDQDAIDRHEKEVALEEFHLAQAHLDKARNEKDDKDIIDDLKAEVAAKKAAWKTSGTRAPPSVAAGDAGPSPTQNEGEPRTSNITSMPWFGRRSSDPAQKYEAAVQALSDKTEELQHARGEGKEPQVIKELEVQVAKEEWEVAKARLQKAKKEKEAKEVLKAHATQMATKQAAYLEALGSSQVPAKPEPEPEPQSTPGPSGSTQSESTFAKAKEALRVARVRLQEAKDANEDQDIIEVLEAKVEKKKADFKKACGSSETKLDVQETDEPGDADGHAQAPGPAPGELEV